MGSCSSGGYIECGLISDQEVHPEHPVETGAEDSTMGERSDFNDFLEANNCMLKMAKEKYDQYDDLRRSHGEMQEKNDKLTVEIATLRQRISNDSEMKHRSHQSSSEDATSRNKRSDVLQKYKKMNGSARRQAIEVLGHGKKSSRAEVWFKKDLTCRIFRTAYELAEDVRNKFKQQALPKIFQCAPSVGVLFEENFSQNLEGVRLSWFDCKRRMRRSHGNTSEVTQQDSGTEDDKNVLAVVRPTSQASKLSQQHVSDEIRGLLSAESFKVACSSVMKEMAVSCDLTDLEEKIEEKLRVLRDVWTKHDEYPYLDDNAMKNEKVKSYIKDCVRMAWRMVNLLPPLKIMTADDVQGRAFDEFFEIEAEENKENAQTMKVCVWPAVTDRDHPSDVLVKGEVVILPKPTNMAQTCTV